MAALYASLFPPSFLPERDMPDLSGKIAFVTGGNTGIGYHTVRQLLLKNATVYLAARSQEKAADAIRRLEEETAKQALFIELDLADLPSVRRAAEAFLAQEARLDLLFNNGGVMTCPPEMITAQNHDLQFGTNVIGHFFLTELLLPALTASHRQTNVRARILNTSSIGHRMALGNGIQFESLKGGPERDAWHILTGRRRLYGASKMANIFVSNYFARTYADVLASCAVHPGGIKTELSRHGSSFRKAAGNLYLFPAPMGAYTQLWGATIVSPEEINGKFLVPWGKIGSADERASNRELEDEVIAYIREQIKDF
ncbi:NAD(P)-binding protein [Mycena olivaceomarginata]|nr:NAD(P)-binding protein [Mycena olivaceomarginata]